MSQEYYQLIANELNIQLKQVAATAALLEEGGTVPFIARYRKEMTGTLDEVAIMQIRDRLAQLAELNQRKQTILKSLSDRELLTDELKEQIEQADTLTTLEDIYLPYRPKRRTRAMIAKEKGLDPLAELLLAQDAATDPVKEAAAYIDADKGVEDVEQALAGAGISWPNNSPRPKRPVNASENCISPRGHSTASSSRPRKPKRASMKTTSTGPNRSQPLRLTVCWRCVAAKRKNA